MSDYLSVVYGCIANPGSHAFGDGEELANQCLKPLRELESTEANDKKRFPPRLLILLASPAYLDESKAQQLLHGVYQTFQKYEAESGVREDEQVKLIGSTVAAVFFNHEIHHNGALLICLASRLITAAVAVGPEARTDPKGAVAILLKNFKIESPRKVDPNPLANRRIITFMPGCRQDAAPEAFYPAPAIHRSLYHGVHGRIRLVGGVSSANDPSRRLDGLQFAQDRVWRDAVVAASIKSDVPIGIGLNDGLERLDRILQITGLDADQRTVSEFDGRPAHAECNSGELMLAKLSADDDRIIDIPLPVGDRAVQLLRQARCGDYFELVRARKPIKQIIKQGIKMARERVYARKPVATLILACKVHSLSENDTSNLSRTLAELEDELGGPCLGGFFDGELGVDDTGRSRLTNGGIAYAVFGDELRERTPLYEGVSALASRGAELLAGLEVPHGTTEETIAQTIKSALKIVEEAGFPGAMISLKQFTLDRTTNQKKYVIIAKQACGRRYPKIIDLTKRSCDSDDVLALVANSGQAQFVADSEHNEYCDKTAIGISGVISQYVLPLKRLDGSVFGILQVDLGDLRNYAEDDFLESEQARMLNCFAVVIGAGISRIAQSLKTSIAHRLDEALKDSMSAFTVHDGLRHFVEAAGEAFGAEMVQLRLLVPDPSSDPSKSATLKLETGFGPWYDVEREFRQEISVNSRSPIACAFRAQEPQIVNHLNGDPAWQAIREETQNESADVLHRTKSYAAVSFLNDQLSIGGAISFGSTKEWFFLSLHEKALKLLAGRLAFLHEHLKATSSRDALYKQKEGLFEQRRFLYRASPNWSKQNLRDVRATLRNVTRTFRRAINADAASLYLWDQDRQQYVLRAQDCWKRKHMLDAANYDKRPGWIGITANREPLYVPDLYAHYKKEGYTHYHGLYSLYIFGRKLSETFKVEAISLPLRIGPAKQDKFGVLTLYKVRNGREKGFVTTSHKVLQRGAYNTAGLVNAVLKQRDADWTKKQESYRDKVIRAINSTDESAPFEMAVCREVLKAYGAAEVLFYRIKHVDDKELISTWIAGCRRDERSQQLEKVRTPRADDERLIQQTLNHKPGKSPYRVFLQRYKLPQDSNPKLLKIQGLPEKACVPLLSESQYRAALVIRWNPDPDRAFELDLRQDARPLRKLGVELAAIDLKREMKGLAERSQLAVQAAGIYVFQHAHKLANHTQSLYRITEEISIAPDEIERRQKIQELERIATQNNRMIDWIIALGEQVQNPLLAPVCLYDLLEKSWGEVSAAGLNVNGLTGPGINVLKDITVKADVRLSQEVFVNLFNNALKALNQRPDKTVIPYLTMSALVDEDAEQVTIIVKDNGRGMDKKDIEAAELGFVPGGLEAPYGRHKGVGVLISRYLLQVQKGTLKYESELGKGTTAIVTLPLFRDGRRRNDSTGVA